MKVNGNGQGKIFTPEELRLLFTDELVTPRDHALFGICLFTGCGISEALALQTTGINSGTITFRKSTTKGKLKIRVVDIQPGLAAILALYQPKPGALFPGRRGVTERLTRFASDKILKGTHARASGCLVSVPLSGAENSGQSHYENLTTLENSIRQSNASRLR